MYLDDYILAHIDPEPEYLHRLWRSTHLHLNYPRMASGHLQGQVLRMLVHMIRPKNVLEIGTYTGYSALAMASALEPGALLHTIERNDEQEDFTRPWLEGSPWADRIRFYIGDALELLKTIAHSHPSSPTPTLPTSHSQLPTPPFPLPTPNSTLPTPPFDLVFIDADKRQYPDYYHAVLPLVRPGGFILADNTLWDGHVLDTSPLSQPHTSRSQPHTSHSPLPTLPTPHSTLSVPNSKSSQTQGILAFNDLVAADPTVEKVILPLRDGLTLIRKRPLM